jgi:hypothetical protein
MRVRYGLRPKFFIVILAGFSIAVISALLSSLDSWGERILFGAFVAFLFWWILRSLGAGLFIAPFKYAMLVYSHGVKFVGCGLFAKWDEIKEIVVFSYEGEKHFGFRLKDDLTTIQGRHIDEYMDDDLTWDVFKMPFATMYKSLFTPADEIIEMFHSQYGVAVRYNERDLEMGEEAEI